MPGILAAILIVVPLVELWIIVRVASEIGIWETVVSLLAVGVVGTWLLIREGRRTWVRLRATIAEGRVPTNELIEGGAILVGGALLLTPGFLTDLFGLLLLIPPTRRGARGLLRRGFSWWVRRRVGGRTVIETVAVTKTPPRPSPRETPAPRLPSSGRPDDEAGSRDKG